MANTYSEIKTELDGLELSTIIGNSCKERMLNFNAANMACLPISAQKFINQFKNLITSPNQNYRLRDEFIPFIKERVKQLHPDITNKSIHISYGATLIFNFLCMILKIHGRYRNFIALSGEHGGLLAPFEGFLRIDILEDIQAFEDRLRSGKVDGICISDIRYKDGANNNLKEIANLRDKYSPNTIIIADLAQSFSISEIPFEYFDIGVASAHKWLAGASGHGFIWISKALEKELLTCHLRGTSAKSNSLGFVGGHDFRGLIETYQALALRIKSETGYKKNISAHIENLRRSSKLKIDTMNIGYNTIFVKTLKNAFEIYNSILTNKLDIKFINDRDPVFRITIPYFISEEELDAGFAILKCRLS